MVSNAFKGAYTNMINEQNKTFSTISSGAKDTLTAVGGILGFTGVLGDGVIATASKHALANKVGGIGGNIMLASMDQRVNSIKNSMVSDLMTDPGTRTKTDVAFEKVAGELKTDQEFKTLDTVFNKLQMQADRAKETEMSKRLESAYKEVDRV